MSAICQFNQYGHCKVGSKCDKFHTTVTCNNFPCQDNECSKRHPKLCMYFSAYGRCMFGDECSFLHYSDSRVDPTASDGLQQVVQAVSELKNEVRNLRLEVDKLGNENRHLLEKIKDLKEEIDVDRVIRSSPAHVTRPEVDSTSGDNQPEVDHEEIVQLFEDIVAALQQKDVTSVLDAMDGFATILTTAERLNEVDEVVTTLKCGGMNRLLHLQHHPLDDIRRKAVQILRVFYPDEDWDGEEGDNMPKAMENGTGKRGVNMTKAKVAVEDRTGKEGVGYNGGKAKKSKSNPGRGRQNLRRK